MAESAMTLFSFQEIAEMMIKHQGIHEGLWGIYLRFGIGAVNAGDATGTLYPTALVPVKEIGLQRFEEVNNLSVDASKVNPKVKATKTKTKTKTKATKSKRT